LIDAYVASGSPLDKAGVYGIQDNEKFPIVKAYKGSYDNIVGFPINEIKFDIENLKK
jgi:septum formation protein